VSRTVQSWPSRSRSSATSTAATAPAQARGRQGERVGAEQAAEEGTPPAFGLQPEKFAHRRP
jgi:hypothetical protein